MITGIVRQGALPFASRVLTLGALTVGAPLLAQPPGPEGLRAEVDAQYRVTATRGGIGLLPRDDERGIALIELRGETVYIDGDGPLSVQRLTDDLGADAAPLLRLLRLDPAAQRSLLGLPALAADDAAAAVDTAAAGAADAGADSAGTADAVADGAAGAEAANDAAADTTAAAALQIAPPVPAAPPAPPAPTAPPAAVAAPPTPTAPPAPAAPPPAPTAPPAPEARRTVRRNVVRFGGDVHVPADERLEGDVVLIGGSLRVDGEVTRDIVVIGGSAAFGPEAVARREVTIVGGRVTQHPDARFERGLNEVGIGDLDLDLGGLGSGPGLWWPRPRMGIYRSSDLMETFIRFAFLGLLGSVVLLVAAGSARRVAERVTREPVKAGVVGFLAQLLFLPLLITGMVVLIVTLIGIPLLALVPVVCVGALVVLVLGFTGVVQLVSRLLARGERSDFVLFWVGLVLLMTPALFGDALDMIGGPFRLFAVVLGVTGFVIEYLAWTTGSGAVILNWFGGDAAPAGGGALPPPIPSPAQPPTPPAPLLPAG